MIKVFHRSDGHWQLDSWDKPELPSRNVWVDLVSPTPEEISQVQKHFSIEIPSQAEMQEIEATSRLYQENGAYFMTATAVASPEHDSMQSSAITFILSAAFLITVRYLNPKPFDAFAARIQKHGSNCASSTDVMIGLLEAIIDRMADILEMHSAEVERLSRLIFPSGSQRPKKKIDLHALLLR